MKKGLIFGALAGAAVAAAGWFIYKKKQDEYNEYDEDIDDDFDYDDECCCDECKSDEDEMPGEKPADGAIETDHCSASSADATADAADDTDTEENI